MNQVTPLSDSSRRFLVFLESHMEGVALAAERGMDAVAEQEFRPFQVKAKAILSSSSPTEQEYISLRKDLDSWMPKDTSITYVQGLRLRASLQNIVKAADWSPPTLSHP